MKKYFVFVLILLVVVSCVSKEERILETSIEISKEMAGGLRQQISDDLRRGDKTLSFPFSEIEIETGEAKIIAYGVKNNEDIEIRFDTTIISTGDCEVKPEPNEDCPGFLYDHRKKPLVVNEYIALPIQIKAPNKKGSFLYEIEISVYGREDSYITDNFFVNVV
ncbi:hypothetical protein ACFLZX_04105 [Nanoarchaeota archaeon]